MWAESGMRNVHCHPQRLWLGGKIIFPGSCFSSCRPVLPRNKEEHFYLQIHISLLPVFWDGKEDAIFLKRLGNNSFLSINCLPCVCLVPISYTEENKMWSSTAQHWHYCWRDQVYRPESAVTLSWGYTVILSRKPSLMTMTRCTLPFFDSTLSVFYHW